MLEEKVLDPSQTESKSIGAWIVRLVVVAALRQLLEDMDLVKRQDVFSVESIKNQCIENQIKKSNSESSTALHLAAADRNCEAISSLLAWGADFKTLTSDGKTPLALAQDSCLGERERERDPALRLLKRMETKLAADYSHQDQEVRVENNDRGVDSLQQDQEDSMENGWTALMVAAEIGYTEPIDALLKQENNINVKNSRCRSALHIAASAGNAEAVKLLVERNAQLEDKDKNDFTALCSAAQIGCAKSVRILIEAKADLTVKCKTNAPATDSETVLDLARKSGENECIELLKVFGVDGWSPLMVAAEKGPYCVEQFLDVRENLIRLHSGHPFHSRFQKMLHFYSKLVNLQKSWNWGAHEEKNLEIDGRKVSKMRDMPDYSGILGDVAFKAGEGAGEIHRWTLLVKNVRSMWAGIAHRVTTDQLGIYYPGGNRYGDGCCCCIVFGSNSSDVRVFGDKAAEVTLVSRSGYSDGQKLDFELNMYDRSLKFWVDEVLAVVVSNISWREVQPYVCMDYSETVELLGSTSFAADDSPVTQLDKPLEGDQNSGFSHDFDTELLLCSSYGPATDPSISTLPHSCISGWCIC
jgi:hypothetical protein